MNQMTNVAKMFARDKLAFYIPWIILFSSFFVNMIIGGITFLSGGDAYYTGGIASIYITMLVVGIALLPQMFPFALGLSVRRKDFFLGISGTMIVDSIGIAIVLFLLSFVEQWTGGWGLNFHFFHLPYLNDGSVIQQLLTNFMLALNMGFLGIAIASVYQRFGRIGLFIFFGAIAFIVTVCSFLFTYYEWWVDVFHWLGSHTVFTLTMWSLPLIVIYILVSYLFLRRATV